MLRIRLAGATAVLCGLIGASTAYTQTASGPAFDFTTTWESKYVSEGRDNLEDGGILAFEAAAEWRGLTAGAWLAAGDSESYEELNLYAEYGFELGPVAAYAGHTRLEFLEDDESDNEISAGIAITDIPYVIPALDYTYSTEADGGFVELSFRSEAELLDGRLALEPYVLEGFDFGYASEEYDGPNNFQVGIDFGLEITDQISVIGSAAHSWAHGDVRRDGLGDVSWMSVGVSVGF